MIYTDERPGKMVREGGIKGESKVFNGQANKIQWAHPQTYTVYIVSVTYNLSKVEHVMGARQRLQYK